MAGRVTIQDIADELGLSRNTVSKALNNTGLLADGTRQRVLAKAIEMGYKQFSYLDPETFENRPKADEGKNEIALLSTWFLNSSHFSATMLDKFQLEISRSGYSMSMHIVRPADLQNKTLPAALHTSHLAGLICFELFDQPYAEMLCESGIPTLFVDTPVRRGTVPLKSDVLLMDNATAIGEFISRAADRGMKKIGFVGEAFHCRSFFERYMAFRDSMFFNGLPVEKQWDLHENPGAEKAGDEQAALYRRYLDEQIGRMKSLPDVFICANDFVAIDLINALRSHGFDVPKDVKVLGFDDSSESSMFTPKLSTVHIHSQILGSSAAYLLMSRIADPDINFRTVHCETDLVLRESTEE